MYGFLHLIHLSSSVLVNVLCSLPNPMNFAVKGGAIAITGSDAANQEIPCQTLQYAEKEELLSRCGHMLLPAAPCSPL